MRARVRSARGRRAARSCASIGSPPCLSQMGGMLYAGPLHHGARASKEHEAGVCVRRVGGNWGGGVCAWEGSVCRLDRVPASSVAGEGGMLYARDLWGFRVVARIECERLCVFASS